MNFTSSADRRVTILPVLTKISYVIRHVITFTLHTNLFIPRKRKSIAVNNRWLTDSSVVSEKLKVKEEIKILEDYYVMT